MVLDPSLTSRCLCGAVRFELTEPATAAGYCHGTRCQRRTRSASSGGMFRSTQRWRV